MSASSDTPCAAVPSANNRATPFRAAMAYLVAGLSVIPIRRDGSKIPPCAWKEYETRLPTQGELRQWFERPEPPGLAVVCGSVSGGLETIDFDHAAEAVFPAWRELVEAESPGLFGRLTVARTPGGGYHVRYRCTEATVPGNTKLAQEPYTDPETSRTGLQTLIETRGEGGYALAPGCPAECHPRQAVYKHFSGPKLSQVQTITAAQREILLRCAQSFDHTPPQGHHTADTGAGIRPGDDFNQSGPDWSAILEPHGWRMVRQQGKTRFWCRPGKSGPGWSATTGRCTGQDGADLLAVFSSNAQPFQGAANDRPCSCYSKFAAKALLEHGGDFSAAARSLAQQDYGNGSAHGCPVGQHSPSQPSHHMLNHQPTQPDSKPEPVLVKLSQVQAVLVAWLWQPWIPRGAVTVLDGDPGLGKSTLSLDLAARVSRGWEMPPAPGQCQGAEPAGVLLLSAEDSLCHTLRPRLDAAGADPERVHALTAVRTDSEEAPPVLPYNLVELEKVIRAEQIALVIVDPFMAYLDGQINAHKDQDVRRCLHRLQLVGERTGAAILLIRHLNKLSGGAALYRGGGSIGIVGAARSALIVGRHPKDSDQTRVLACNKSNLGPKPRSLTYNLVPTGDVARIGWGEECDWTADEILQPSIGGHKQSIGEQCAQVIRELLQGQEIASNELEQLCRDRGFSPNAIRDGRRLAQVQSRRVGFSTGGQQLVSLPDTTTQHDEEPP